MKELNDFIDRVKAYLDHTGLSKTYLGKIACNNSKAVSLLLNKGTITIKTVSALSVFMDENPNWKRYGRTQKINNRPNSRNGEADKRKLSEATERGRGIQTQHPIRDFKNAPLHRDEPADNQASVGSGTCELTPNNQD